MGRIVLHAGMPKAGSSSVIGWLAQHAGDLWKESGIRVCVAQTTDAVVRVVPYVSGSVDSRSFVLAAVASKEQPDAIIESFAASLDQVATSAKHVVLSGAFAEFFWRPDSVFLVALQELTDRHEVHVAYYVRPQHASSEAAWRQWGFRYSTSPSAYIASRERQLRYLDTYRTVRRLAPDVRFVVRPFRPDLLDGNVATDFDRHFLRGDAAPTDPDPPWRNRGLPLDVVSALRGAPRGLLWDSPHDNRAIPRVKELVERLDAAESEEALLGRRILTRYAYDLYEPGNCELIAELGWDTDAFIQGVDLDGESGDLSRLDELWTSRASPLELALLHQAVAEAVNDHGRVALAPRAGGPQSTLGRLGVRLKMVRSRARSGARRAARLPRRR